MNLGLNCSPFVLTRGRQRVLVKEELKLLCMDVCTEVYYFLEGTVHSKDVLLPHSRRS